MQIGSILQEKVSLEKASLSTEKKLKIGDIEDVDKLVAELFTKVIIDATKIVTGTRLLRSGIPHKVSSAFYRNTRRLKNVLNFVLLPSETDIVFRFTVRAGTYEIAFTPEYLYSMVPLAQGYPLKELTWALSYVIGSFSAWSPQRTHTVLIDDDEKITQAMQAAVSYIKDPHASIVALLPLTGVHFGNTLYSRNDRVEAYGDVVTVINGKMVKAREHSPVYAEKAPCTEMDYYRMFALLLLSQEVVSYDTETTGLDPYSCELVSFGVSMDVRTGFYVCLSHALPPKAFKHRGELSIVEKTCEGYAYEPVKNIRPETAEKLLKIIQKKKLVMHNAGFDYSVTLMSVKPKGVKLPLYFDTMVAHYVARPAPSLGDNDDSSARHGLKIVAPKELGVDKWNEGVDVKKIRWEDRSMAGIYCAKDVCYTMALSMVFLPDVLKNKVFFDIEMPFITAIASAQLEGVGVDRELFNKLEADLLVDLEKTKAALVEASGQPDINIDSTADLSKLFLEKMGLKPWTRCRKCFEVYRDGVCTCPKCGQATELKVMTPGGKPSMNKQALSDLATGGVALAKMIVEYRANAKLLSTYVNIPDKANKHTGYVHPGYGQTRTITGRLCVAAGANIDIVRDVSKYPKGIPIEEVKIGDLAFTYDAENRLTLKPVIWAGKTGTKQVVRLHYWDGNYSSRIWLDLTPEHLVRKVGGAYVRAEDLVPGDRVMALSRHFTEGYTRLNITGTHSQPKEHRFILNALGLIDGSDRFQQAHHKDGNKLNNSLANLEVMSVTEHAKMHWDTMPVEKKAELAKKSSEHSKKLHARGAIPIQDWFGEKNPRYRKFTRADVIRALARGRGMAAHSGVCKSTIVTKAAQHGIALNAIRFRYDNDGKLIPMQKIRRALNEIESITGIARYLNVWIPRAQRLLEVYGLPIPKPTRNHRIISVERIEIPVDVYDLEVQDTHNFIANEICVHNSSSNPNFQQLPKKGLSKYSKLIRKGILAKAGRILLTADYAGQEVRVLTAYCRDERLIKAYNPCYECPKNPTKLFIQKGKCPCEDKSVGSACDYMDVHSAVTAMMYPDIIGNCPISEIKEKFGSLRDKVKSVVFALVYGGGPAGIAEKNGISLEEAKSLVQKFFEAFPTILEYVESVKTFMSRYGYIDDLVGRRRVFRYAGYEDANKAVYFEPWNMKTVDEYGNYVYEKVMRPRSDFYRLVSSEWRQGINFPIQGLAASMTKIATNELTRKFEAQGIDAVISGFIHDKQACRG